jgi:hypothetical protein
MTLNLIWSDKNYSYLIADSARTTKQSKKPPDFPYSVLGQNQWLAEKEISVEEGVQKIVRINSCIAVALCGNEIDVIAFTEHLKSAFHYLDAFSFESFTRHLIQLPLTARFEISIAQAGGIYPSSVMETLPAFMVLKFPEKQIIEVQRTHMHIAGSLANDKKAFLATAIQQYLIEDNSVKNPELRLVAGLACATTMAANFNLTENFVGGAFFGGWLDDANFFWQPDIVYILYHPIFSMGVSMVSDLTELSKFSLNNPSKYIDVVACVVRNDITIAISLKEQRAVTQWSELFVDGVYEQEWLEKFESELSSIDIFEKPKYFAFIPKTMGRVIVVPNNEKYVQINQGKMAIADILVEKLKTTEQFELLVTED